MKALTEQIRALLPQSRACHSDFEKYDAPAIEECSEPFFFLTTEWCTSLTHIGPRACSRWYGTEAGRMAMFRDSEAPLSSIESYFSYDGKARCWYWDGLELKAVRRDEVRGIYGAVCGGYNEAMAELHRKEAEIARRRLELVACTKVGEAINAVQDFARSIGDASFIRCLRRLRRWRRMAANHYIDIHTDCCEKSFYFVEVVNGEARSNGGIIYHPNLKDNHWSIHT